MDCYRRVIVLGPPGSGKGTRARILGEILGVPVVTTGDMLRDVISRGTELGRVAAKYISKGELVPDPVVNRILEQRLNEPDVKEGFILDGFPRSEGQAEALECILKGAEIRLDAVLSVELDERVVVNRLSKRRSCPECGAIYHLEHHPPVKDGVCDVCGSQLVQREDDVEDIILNRLEVYRELTQPLIKRYEGKGIVKTISGDMPFERIATVLRSLFESC
jgi:adenylate kinase